MCTNEAAAGGSIEHDRLRLLQPNAQNVALLSSGNFFPFPGFPKLREARRVSRIQASTPRERSSSSHFNCKKRFNIYFSGCELHIFHHNPRVFDLLFSFLIMKTFCPQSFNERTLCSGRHSSLSLTRNVFPQKSFGSKLFNTSSSSVLLEKK